MQDAYCNRKPAVGNQLNCVNYRSIKNCCSQDYVDENLAAFQAQITQLQGEYPEWHFCPGLKPVFWSLFAYLCISLLASFFVLFACFCETYCRKISSCSSFHSPQCRRNELQECARATPIHPPPSDFLLIHEASCNETWIVTLIIITIQSSNMFFHKRG